MEPLRIEAPELETLEKIEDEAAESFQKQVIGGEPEVPDTSVDIYLLGLNQRVSGENVNRVAPHIQDPYLMVAFKDMGYDEFKDMEHSFRRESVEELRGLHDRFQDSLGDQGVFLEEYYSLVSDGELETEIRHVPAEVSGIDRNLEAAEEIDRKLGKDPDYEVKQVRFVGGVEKSSPEEALEDIQPALTLDITYSGNEQAVETYNNYLDEHTPHPGGAEAIPGTVYVGKDPYPSVVFSGPLYDTLDDGELERRLWEGLEDK